MKAIIMAGGKGTRLRPLTCNVPKPMVSLLDRPVMEYSIELLKQHGIVEIGITVQFLPEMIRQYFGNGEEFGVNLHYFEEETPLGTAGSVLNTREFLDDTFVVISGDALTDFDLTEAIRFHKQKKSVATLVLTQVNTPLDYGVVMIDDTGAVIRFLEKPSWGEVFSDTVNTGIYILEPQVFKYYESGTEFDFSKDLFPRLIQEEKPLYGYVASGYWSDIGNLSQYRQTQCDMLEGKVAVTIKGTQIAPQVWIGDNCNIGEDVFLNGPSFLGNNCIIEDKVWIGEYTVIATGSLLKYHASVERTIIGKHSIIEQGAELKGATLGQGVKILAGASASEGAVLGDRCLIGKKAIIHPGIKIWPNKSVDDHTTANHSLIWGEKSSKNLFGQFGVSGSYHSHMTTTFIHRLSLAYGSILPIAFTVGVGHDDSSFSRLAAETFASGLHASGINTYDFGTTTSSVTRYGTAHLDSIGGVHIRKMAERSQDILIIEFLDKDGITICKSIERKIENTYHQEDYRLINTDFVGKRRICPAVASLYRESLQKLLNQSSIETMKYKVVLEYNERNKNAIIPDLLQHLGCKVIQVNRGDSTLDEISQLIISTKADFGIQVDDNAQNITLVTDKGKVISEETLFLLQTVLRLERLKSSHIHVPVNVPTIVEMMANQYGKQVIKTKADVRTIMEGCQNEGYHIYYDGLYTVVHTMQLMAERRITLEELIATIPHFTLLKRQVNCPWTEKGTVMRSLMEETQGKQIELIDGIKIFHQEGWTLILPDSDEPIFQVLANATTHQIAEDLTFMYMKKIVEYSQRGNK